MQRGHSAETVQRQEFKVMAMPAMLKSPSSPRNIAAGLGQTCT
tara:strand:+ start:6687 stop:6815 length:129 start_codon:yes stop_codon:yes gene_type:complete